MTRAHLPVVILVLLVLTACSGGGGGDKHATTPTSNLARTPKASPIVKPTPAPSPSGSILPRPGSIEEYPAAIAAYLNKVGDAALGTPCLAELLAGWQMPNGDRNLLGGDRCVLGNTDADPENEVIASLSAESQINGPLSTKIAVLDHTPAGYVVAYAFDSLYSGKGTDVPYVILSTGDLNNDGVGDLAFADIGCGAHTCNWFVHVVSGTAAGYRELTPSKGLTLATADIRIEDTNGDGTKEIIMHGGVIQSAGAGPQRAGTYTYAWDGTQFTLKSSEKDSSDVRLFKVEDADTAFAAGNYQEATHLYQQAVSDTSLQEVGGFGSRDELMAYALFRLGLSYLKLGDTNAASHQIEAAIESYPVSLDGKAALAFRTAATVTGIGLQNLSGGCQAAIAYANQNLSRFREAWNYGYGNPGFDPTKFCPF